MFQFAVSQIIYYKKAGHVRNSELMTYYEELELDIDPGVSPSLTLTVFVSKGATTLQQSASLFSLFRQKFPGGNMEELVRSLTERWEGSSGSSRR